MVGPIYVQATQHAHTEEKYPLLPPKQISLVQKIVGTFLYYSLGFDSAMLVYLSDMVSIQAKATVNPTKMWYG